MITAVGISESLDEDRTTYNLSLCFESGFEVEIWVV